MPKIKWVDMTLPQKRVAIAKDVLESIETKQYIPNTGAYVRNISSVILKTKASNQTSVQKLLKGDKVKKCEVCALGGCFLSVVKFENELTVDTLVNRGNRLFQKSSRSAEARKRLELIFGKIQLGLIEAAFEMSSRFCYYRTSDVDKYKAAAFHLKVKHYWNTKIQEKHRLIAIMRNIIKNNGTFIP